MRGKRDKGKDGGEEEKGKEIKQLISAEVEVGECARGRRREIGATRAKVA
jgi:hypothetical protein